jgi:hypothetical protein
MINQDFFLADKNLLLITDGCSEGEFSEVGTRLFAQMFSQLDNKHNLDKFEENVEVVFSKICSLAANDSQEALTQFIVHNMLFTIIACFELEDRFVVKFIGDGYIITVNSENLVSYIRLSYGKTPPYYAYNKVPAGTYNKPLEFKTFEFDKKDFKKVGIASDGFTPIAEKRIPDDFTPYFLGKKTEYTPEGIIRSNANMFSDDITLLWYEEDKHGI